jgi:hypothetical protein
MSEKIVNYTPEMTAEMVEAYQASPTKATVEALATKFGKSTKSIVAKLAREKVYVKAIPEAGTKRVPKNALIEKLAEQMGVPSEQLEGLDKAPAAVLKQILAALS